MSEVLHEFIKDCTKAGKTHADIRSILLETGWATEQVSEALERYVDRAYAVAIPRPIVFASPRLVFLNVFYFLVLYLSIYSTVSLLFTFLDHYLPDGLGQAPDTLSGYRPIGDAIRWNIASILCLVPLVAWSARIIRQAIAETKQRIPRIRLKLIYLTIFIGACVMLGNVTCFLYYFLSGELGLRFMLKVMILSTLVAGLFASYRVEIKQTEIKA